jgi:hypothetical protein
MKIQKSQQQLNNQQLSPIQNFIKLCRVNTLWDSSIFWDITQYSTLEVKKRSSSETSVDFQRTTLGYIPEDITVLVYDYLCDSLIS